jgi:hypothetical protein
MDVSEQQTTAGIKPKMFSFEDEELSWIPQSEFRNYPFPAMKDEDSDELIEAKKIHIHGLVTRKSKDGNNFGHPLQMDVEEVKSNVLNRLRFHSLQHPCLASVRSLYHLSISRASP